MNAPWIPLRYGAVLGSARQPLPEALAAVLRGWAEHGRIEGATPIKAGRVWRLAEWAIKVYAPQRGWIERLRASPARRNVQLHARIAPVPSPAPLCFLEQPGRGASLLVSQFVEGLHLHQLWGSDPAALRAFPGFLAQMHDARVFHGDLHAGNMLWDGRAWYLLDLDGLRHPLRTLAQRRLVLDHWGRLYFGVARAAGLRELFDAYLERRGLRWERASAWRAVERESRRVEWIRLGRVSSGPLCVDWLQILELPLSKAHALQVLRSADALARRGHRVRVYLRGRGARAACESALGRAPDAGLVAIELPRHKGLAGLLLRLRIALVALRARASWDDARVWLARERALALFALSSARRLRSRAALVYELHNLEHVLAEETGRAGESAAILAQERRLARDAQGLVAISAPLAEDARRALDPARPFALVPDGVDLAAYADPHEPRARLEAPIRLAYAGSLYAHKGVDTLFDMAEELARRAGADAHVLAIAGGEPSPELERLRARAAELAARGCCIELAGALDPRAVPAFLRAADLIVLPSGAASRSLRYTSPLKLFEALASGVPIVAAPSAAHKSVLEHRRNAWLAERSDGAALAEAVLAACGDPAALRARAAAARADAQQYSWERRAAALEAALYAALGARRD